MSAEAAAVDPQEVLAAEGRTKRVAAVAAALACVLQVVGGVLSGAAAGTEESSLARLIAYRDVADQVLLGSTLAGLGAICAAVALGYLYRYVKARKPDLPRLALIMAALGAVGYPVGLVAIRLAYGNFSDDFAGGAPTFARSQDFDAPVVAVSIGLAGQLALGLAFVLTSLNAMRTGLLTRFMGYIGIFAGVLIIIPVGSTLPIVQAFWLGALAALLFGRWPNGLPPAWQTGRAEPWPGGGLGGARRAANADEVRTRGGVGRDPLPEPDASGNGVALEKGTPHPTSKKRKRKRRR